MKLDMVFKLINAGYTKAEIEAMEQVEEQPAKAVEDEKKLQDEKEKSLENGSVNVKESKTEDDPRIAALETNVNKLLDAIQLMNAKNTNMPAPEQEDAELILARIIDPTYKRKK